MDLPCIFITRREGEKEPVIFAVRSEAKLSPETSVEGLFFSRSERQSQKRRSARRPGLRRSFDHTHGSGPAPLPPGHRPPPTPHKAYREHSARMMAIPSEYSPLIRDFDV
jgi:hypothetical protein